MISNLARLKKMHQEKPYLYEEEEHAVLKLAEDAVLLIKEIGDYSIAELQEYHLINIKKWLEEHK